MQPRSGISPELSWRWVAWIAAGGMGLVTLTLMFRPSGGGGNDFGANPYGIESLEDVLAVTGSVGGALLGVAALASIYSLFWRRKRADSIERHQLRWFAYAAALMPIAFMGPE